MYKRQGEVYAEPSEIVEVARNLNWENWPPPKWHTIEHFHKEVERISNKVDPAQIVLNKPPEWWNLSEQLKLIRDIAHSKGRSSEALLGAILSILSASVHYPYVIPDIVESYTPVGMFACLFSDSGAGKSGANKRARRLLEDVVDNSIDLLIPGFATGPAIIEAFHKGKDREYFNAYQAINELQSFLPKDSNQVSTATWDTLKSLWIGEDTAALAINATRAGVGRKLRMYSYNYGMIVGAQYGPAYKLTQLDRGEFERFIFFNCDDKSIPPPPKRKSVDIKQLEIFPWPRIQAQPNTPLSLIHI